MFGLLQDTVKKTMLVGVELTLKKSLEIGHTAEVSDAQLKAMTSIQQNFAEVFEIEKRKQAIKQHRDAASSAMSRSC